MTKRVYTVFALILACSLVLSGCSSFSSTIQEIWDSDNATDKYITLNITFEDEILDLEGKYTGQLKDGKADGTGTFIVEYEEGYKLVYKGSFSNGKINGDGVLTFTAEGYEERYEGSFRNGAFDGQGIISITSNGQTYVRKGTYTRSKFTPTTGEKYDYLGQLDLYGTFSLSKDLIEYIDSSPKYFPKGKKAIAEIITLRDFQYKQFIKTRRQDDVGLIKLKLTIAQIFEDQIDDIDETVTYFLAADSDGNWYTLYYLDSAEIYEGDTITAYALPVATASFDNVGGGVTNVIVLLGSYLEKT